MILATALLLLPGIAAPQERPGLSALSRQIQQTPDPAAEFLAALRARYAAATAIELDTTIVMRFEEPTFEDEEPRVSEMRSQLLVKMAKPLHGSLEYRYEMDGEPMSFLIVADGEKIAGVDDDLEGWYRLGGTLDTLGDYEQIEMLAWWAGVESGELDSILLERSANGRHVLELNREFMTTRLVVGEDGLVVSGWHGARPDRADEVEAGGDISFAVDRTVLHTEPVDLAAWKRTVPEGFVDLSEEMTGGTDFDASLLAVGADAPEVKLTGMDDESFTLASLRGKTVLLNFWFYH